MGLPIYVIFLDIGYAGTVYAPRIWTQYFCFAVYFNYYKGFLGTY